jgi:uncharacterized protein YndB with AHSA1/START domain
MTETTALAPVVKTVLVAAEPARAFEVFTSRFGDWWPLATHSVDGAKAKGVVLDCCEGGEVVETTGDGSREVWGTVVEWEPPERLALTWHPGQPAEEATRVEVAFAAEGTSTRVTLTHSGWDGRSAGAEARASYDSGWNAVLDGFAEMAGSRGVDGA